MRLGDYGKLLRRQWATVLICLLLGIGLAFAYIQFAPREYRSLTSVLVTATDATAAATTDRPAGINLDTEAQLVTATETVSAAAKTLDVPADEAGQLADRVGVSVPPNTEILDITYTGDTAAEAQHGSLAFANAYLEQRKATAQAALDAQAAALKARIDAVNSQLAEVLKAGDALKSGSPERARNNDQAAALNGQLASLTSSQNRVRSETVTPGRIVTQPAVPDSPSSPDPLIAMAAGVLLGLLAGIGLAALRNRADDVIRTPEDLSQHTGVPVVTVLSQRLDEDKISVLQPLGADGRGYARLRNLVSTRLEGSSRRVVLVTGVRRGGGPVAANLAASLARAGEEVVLVCGDVFGSTATALLGDTPEDGLAEVIEGDAPVDSVLRAFPGVPSLRILGPGRDIDRADALLQTRSPRKLVDRLLETASCLVIEAPPTTESVEAQTLANVAALAVLVVEVGPTTAREVLDASAQLEAVGTPVLGAVIARYARDSDSDRRARPVAAKADTKAEEQAEDSPAATDTPTTEVTQEQAPATAEAPPHGAGQPNGNGASAAGAAQVPQAAGKGAGNGSATNGSGSQPGTRAPVLPPGARGPAPR
jgi:capsular polysaccharide biosynthesis protein